ncbi:Hypothetical predicted protein [Pelobates cultripes]|uniref:Uncharacterized protein n=1 Tax=Pelobates cultripes TaxID=61616 RepID=A0AAD1STV8_PELCU|nr:Hypothetical predicted protein [Pelobates cultripes]
MAAAISMAFHEARIEKAFEHFWSQFWSTVGQRTVKEAEASPTPTSPRNTHRPQPAMQGHDTAPVTSRRSRKKRQVPQSWRIRAAKSHPVRLQGLTTRPAQVLSGARGRKGTIPTQGTAIRCPTLPSARLRGRPTPGTHRKATTATLHLPTQNTHLQNPAGPTGLHTCLLRTRTVRLSPWQEGQIGTLQAWKRTVQRIG